MATYPWGSRPVGSYSYKDFVRHLAPHLPPNDKVFALNNSFDWRKASGMPLGLFRSVCHWKSPRRYGLVLLNAQQDVFNATQDAFACCGQGRVRDALAALHQLQGVDVPTASALLTARNPYEFGIIDRRVLAVLRDTGSPLPKNPSAPAYVKLLEILSALRTDLKLRKCSLRQIELAIWHYYAVQREDT